MISKLRHNFLASHDCMRLMTSQVCIFRARSILWAFVVPKLIRLFTTGRSAQPYSANNAVSACSGSGVLTCHLWYPDLAKQQPWWGFKKFFCNWIQKRLHSAKRSTFAQFFLSFPGEIFFVSQVSLLSAKSCQFAKIFIRLPLPLVEHQKLAFAKKLAGCMTSCRQTGVDRLKRKKPRLWRSGNNWILRSHHCKKKLKKNLHTTKKTAPVYCQGKTSTRKWIIKI